MTLNEAEVVCAATGVGRSCIIRSMNAIATALGRTCRLAPFLRLFIIKPAGESVTLETSAAKKPFPFRNIQGCHFLSASVILGGP
jgi:hypothetical protein